MIVALLTDFATRDHYVGAMKGVILSVCPEATLVDITHDIPPQDIGAGRDGSRAALAGVVRTYVDVEPGSVCALVGSSERLEIAVSGGSAADRLHADRGTSVRVLTTDD